jgi:hypothetical protein
LPLVSEQLSITRIIGVGLLLFSSILLGVGIHHIVSTGTCSSTGYSPNYGPVPHCPSGTGAWFAFVFGGIIGSLAGGMMGAGLSGIFFGIFGGIGFGALTLGLSSSAHGGTKTFAIAFGAPFALVGLIAGGATVWTAIQMFERPSGTSNSAPTGPTGTKTRHPGRRTGGPAVATNAITPPSTPFRPTTTVAPAAYPATANTASTAGQVSSLAQLAELHRQGALSDAEFAAAKARVIGGVSA